MKPTLVIGLGNPLMGDEGIGWHVIDRLAADSRLPPDTDLLWGSTDLLGCAGQMEGRRRVILVDALLDPTRAGSLVVYESADGFPGLDDHQEHAHQLSVVQAIRLLQLSLPVRITLIAVGIEAAHFTSELSPALAAKMPEILDQVLQVVTE